MYVFCPGQRFGQVFICPKVRPRFFPGQAPHSKIKNLVRVSDKFRTTKITLFPKHDTDFSFLDFLLIRKLSETCRVRSGQKTHWFCVVRKSPKNLSKIVVRRTKNIHTTENNIMILYEQKRWPFPYKNEQECSIK